MSNIKKSIIKKSIVVCLLAAVLLVSMVGMASAHNSITWNFDSETTTAGREMERCGGPGDNGQTGSVLITAGNSVIWTSDEAAAYDVGFSAQTWNGQIAAVTPSSNKKFKVEVGMWDGTFHSKGTSGEYTLDHPSGQGRAFNVQVIAFTVPEDKWVAVKVSNTGGVDFNAETDGSCLIVYPPPKPDYPYPELSTLVLLSVGLLTLIGYVGLRRRRNNELE